MYSFVCLTTDKAALKYVIYKIQFTISFLENCFSLLGDCIELMHFSCMLQ